MNCGSSQLFLDLAIGLLKDYLADIQKSNANHVCAADINIFLLIH